ncbi:L-cysteine desulfidase family protein [Arabiibacter massiliensis]|uniref:L-cysteine desulfidase family protein n=1 Tax=Arabiibacter massiliensis TaxID=1870985 RepID=UPI0009B98EAE|nr:L-serine ammonia-lyase, iron-sulfur-dependent, subunit alpha [Arabiibacter massiliensis]
MDRTDERYGQYVAILEEELIAAMGCTEPIAIALAAARARELLGTEPARVSVAASGSIIKNAKSVVVPHTGGLKGIEAAAAAGIVAGRPERKLEVIAEVGPDEVRAIAGYLARASIEVARTDDAVDFDVVVRVAGASGQHEALVRIADYHTNIVREERDGEVLLDAPLASEAGTAEGLTDRSVLTMAGIWDFATTVDLDDVRGLLERQIACNDAIAREGLAGDWGANIGSVMLGAYGDDIKVRACACAAAASDARMSGCELPVVINSGSGNQGITVSVPLIEYARHLGSTEEQLLRALALSNLVAIHQKTGIGRLSAFCGAVCAGAAAGAGIAYLDGGGYKEACHAVVNALSIVAGMVCDGAKPSCAGKIAFSVNAGILGYVMYRDGQQFYGGDGIVKKGVENTIDSIARLGRDGMRATNDEIIRIMLGS